MIDPVPPLPRLAKYDVLEEIGHGGMATVYRATDKRLHRDVAVKIIHRHLRESAEVGRRFTAEARAVAKLRHPNIVEIYDVSDDDTPERYLVAELVRGKSLRQVLLDAKDLPAEIAAAIGIEICAALAHAHDRGVVHRDVKPENVLFGFAQDGDKDGPKVAVKITDFGIAKMLDQQGVTVTGQVLGSPAYMAPEQIECGDVDSRSDIFSLGVLLYECMVGHLPFEGKNPAQVLRRVLDGQFPAADRERPTVGASFAAIVAKALAHEADARFASMDELRAALEGELKELGIDDPRGDIAKYFERPAAYRAELPARLVPRLVARGRAAHAKGDVVAAAAAFNRALAFAPGDKAVLAYVTGLSRAAARKAMLRNGALGLFAVSVVSLAAWGTVKVLRKPAPVVAIETVPTKPSSSEPAIRPDPSATAAPPPSASVAVASSQSAPAHVVTAPPAVHAPPQTPATARPAGERSVHFVVNPKGALVSIDGGPPEEGFGLVKTLSLGPHTAVLTAPKEGLSCCIEVSRSINVVEPPDGTDAPQTVALKMKFRDATVVSIGPETAQMRCPTFGLNGVPGRGNFSVRMEQLDDDGECILFDGGTQIARKAIHLRAGKETNLVWPSPGP